MRTFILHAHNGFQGRKRDSEHVSVTIQAESAAEAVRAFAANIPFKKKGPNGYRIASGVEQLSEDAWVRIPDHAYVGVLNTFPGRVNPAEIVTDGLIII